MEPSNHTLWFARTIGFIVGFIVAVAFEVLIFWAISELFSRQFYPRGIGWVILPFTGGIVGAKVLPEIRFGSLVEIVSDAKQLRYSLAAIASWVLLVFAYVYVAQPFGSYISSNEWASIFRWLLIPPVVACVILFLFRWASLNRTPRA